MFYYLCKLIITSTTLLYPTYASYKTLRLPSGSAEQREALERWVMFWCVMGVVWAWEEVGEWGVGWFPFYYEFKTLVLLWLALPQIQGSTFIYLNHLSPFLTSHESDIDAFISNLRSSAVSLGASYVQRALRAARQAVLGQFLADAVGGVDAPPAPAGTGQQQPLQPPPVLANPPLPRGGATPAAAAGNSLASLAGGLMRQYGPAALAAGQALLHPNAGGVGGGVAAASAGGAGAKTRREELERELASLDGTESDASAASSTSGVAGAQSAEGLRARGGGRSPSSSSSVSGSGIPSSLSSAGAGAGGGGAPKDPVAARYLQSLTGSAYEEIRHADASGFGGGGGGGNKEGAGGGGEGKGWFGWGAGKAQEAVREVERERERERERKSMEGKAA